ncbi:MAG TPA: TnsD family Tn7-like transposition protein [Patescibacteria group bacterium]|nr:TnsD family Tn7-like transposition protein [Patescibacteria group bacterium]
MGLINIEPNKEFEYLKVLTHDVNWIFDNFTLIKDIKDFREKYLAILKEIGLATSTGRVYQAELLQSFVNYYGNTLLKLLQSDIDYNNQDNWVSSIVRKHRKAFHPLRHLLLMKFLAGSAEKFYNLSAEYNPFGKGPWICLNAAADHYKEPVIKELDITHCMDTKLPVGTFKCSCGFIYSRRGPDTSNEDKYRIGRIKAFGTVWEDKLKKYVEDEKLSMRETARRLNVDPNTVKKYASALELNNSWDSESCKSGVTKRIDYSCQTDIYESKKTQYRSQWVDIIKSNPGQSAAVLRNAAEGVYMWLYKNDKVWLNTNTPKLDIRKNKANRVDWKERDKQLFRLAREALNEIIQMESKPTRITISRIGKATGNLALLEKHLAKLPLTKRYLLDHIESIEAFQKRRVIWAANELNKNGEELKKWKIIRKAGLRSEYKDEIDGAIDEIVERYDKFQYSYWGEKH